MAIKVEAHNVRIKLSPYDELRVAVRARCDPRTVCRRLSGGRVQPSHAQRIDVALAELGFVDVTPTASIRPQESSKTIVHLAGFARWRDKSGNVFAPCGALIHASNHDVSATRTLRQVKPSATELSYVTCLVCQEQVAAVGKAYQAARRHKEIAW